MAWQKVKTTKREAKAWVNCPECPKCGGAMLSKSYRTESGGLFRRDRQITIVECEDCSFETEVKDFNFRVYFDVERKTKDECKTSDSDPQGS